MQRNPRARVSLIVQRPQSLIPLLGKWEVLSCVSWNQRDGWDIPIRAMIILEETFSTLPVVINSDTWKSIGHHSGELHVLPTPISFPVDSHLFLLWEGLPSVPRWRSGGYSGGNELSRGLWTNKCIWRLCLSPPAHRPGEASSSDKCLQSFNSTLPSEDRKMYLAQLLPSKCLGSGPRYEECWEIRIPVICQTLSWEIYYIFSLDLAK